MPDNPFEPMIKNIGNYVSGTLYAQGVIPPIGIDNYEGLALASQADTHLLAAKDPVIDEIAVGMTGNLISGKTVSGAPPLQLPNSAGYPLQYWNVNVSPKQDLNGYDAPWPAGGGANIYDGEYQSGYYDITDGTWHDSNSWTCSKNPIPCSAETSYRFIFNQQASTGSLGYVLYYDASDNYLSSVQLLATTYSGGQVFTTPANTAYIKFYSNIRWFTEATLAIVPSSVTTWSPYSNICPIHGTDKLNMFVEESYDQSATPEAVITLQETVYNGTVSDYGGVIKWGEVDLGTLEWTYVNGASGINYFLSDAISNAKRPSGNAVVANAICSTYPTISAYDVYLGNIGVGIDTVSKVMIYDPAYTDAASFKTAMSGAQLVYEFATPTEFAVTAPSIQTPSGSAATWATSEDGTVNSMEVGYIQNE